MPIEVRDARAEDFEAVTRLLEELGRPAVLGTDAEHAHRRRFAAWLDAPDNRAFVATEDGRVVGFVDLVLLDRLNFDGPEAWVPDLVVAEVERSRGAGAALLRAAEEAARERGAWGLRLESAHWRTRAHAFYTREGYEDRAKSFHKLLADIAWPPSAPASDDAKVEAER